MEQIVAELLRLLHQKNLTLEEVFRVLSNEDFEKLRRWSAPHWHHAGDESCWYPLRIDESVLEASKRLDDREKRTPRS